MGSFASGRCSWKAASHQPVCRGTLHYIASGQAHATLLPAYAGAQQRIILGGGWEDTNELTPVALGCAAPALDIATGCVPRHTRMS